jgi:hypothetical protein
VKKEAKRIKKRGEAERFTVGLTVEYPSVFMVEEML